jgi:hypothetical protein
MPLVISGITIAGANPGDFSQTNNCSASLAVGASCSISVTFAPVSVGNFTATLLVTDNAPGSPQSLSLSGSETAVVTVTPDFTISASPGSEAMPSGMTANYMVTVGETGGFGGSVSLAVTGLPSGATASFSPSVVTPGAGGATSMLTVQTGASAAVARSRTRGWLLAMPMLGVVLLVPSRRRQWVSRTLMVLVCLISLGIVAAMTGCGGGFALPKNSPSYTLTITGSSGSTSHSTTVQLTVK